MKTIEFIEAYGVDALTSELGIKVRKYPEDDLMMLNYDQIESPKTHPVVIECRSLILNLEGTKVISRKFDRFFNLGEAPEIVKDFNFETASILEKVDGSLCGVYFNPSSEKWEISTRSMAKAEGEHVSGKTFREMIEDAFARDMMFETTNVFLCKKFTYVFEFVSPLNRIVTPYSVTEMVLTGVIENSTGRNFSYANIESDAYMLFHVCGWNVRCVRKIGVEEINPEEIQTLANDLKNLEEGFVLFDDSVPSARRIKVKSRTYLTAHKMRGENSVPTRKNILSLIFEGEVCEFIAYFPEWKELIENVEKEVVKFENTLLKVWEAHRNIGGQKEFALAVKETKGSQFLFRARQVAGDPVDIFRHETPVNTKQKLFEQV